MADSISQFSVRGLHSAIDVTVPIEDGKIILVGANGLGKTTLVSVLYFFLTRQWARLVEFDFQEISLQIADEDISVSRSDLFLPETIWQESLLDSMPEFVIERLKTSRDFQRLVMTTSNRRPQLDYSDFISVARKLELPVGVLERAAMEFSRGSHHGKKHRKSHERVEKAESRLSRLAPQVLYLPTYRRIEQDLKSIFPEYEGDFKKVIKSRASKQSDFARGGFVEFVEFGMEDVEARVQSRVAALKENSRVELNNLAGGYLRDVIRGEARQWNGEKIKTLSDDEVQIILGRVEEKQLNEDDKRILFQVINLIRNGDGLTSDHELLAHFFSKLVQIYEAQRTSEIPVRQFIEVCNKYLTAKEFSYDDVNFHVPLLLEAGDPIRMKDLSSGEKQIVSLFAQIYLGNAPSYYVIIDEPELSLSVEWQRTLLSDLVGSGRCDFLAAVTHSPFIYDNELEPFAKDLAQFQTKYLA